MLCIAVHELLGKPQHNVKQNTTFYIGVYPRNLIVEAKTKKPPVRVAWQNPAANPSGWVWSVLLS